MILQIIYAFIVSMGFGILFNVRDKNLFFAGLGGTIGWFFYMITMEHTSSAMLAIFIGSIAISACAEIFSRVLKNPVTLFLICALIPLVPGSGMYYTVFYAVQGELMDSISMGFETLALAGLIALGIILVSTVSRLIQRLYIMSKNKKLKLK